MTGSGKETLPSASVSASASASASVDEIQEALDGYVLDPARYPFGAAGLKLSPDSHHVLIPQPSDAAADPLNWAKGRKRLTLAVIAYIAALADYTAGTAIITVIPQSLEWHMSQQAVQRAVYSNIFAVGVCGLFFVALANYFGRLPVTLFFQAVFLATCAWSASATSFRSYLGARIVNGLVCSAGQGGALMWVKDMFFFHEHPRAINHVELAILTSPYLGPLVTAFIVSATTWRWAYWLCTMLAGGALLATLFLLDETLYTRSLRPESLRETGGSRLSRLVGAQQARSFRRRSAKAAMLRPVVAITKLPVLLTIVYYFLNSAWVIGVNTTVSIWLTEFYAFTPRDIGFFYFFGIVGSLIGWLLGHYLHDAVGKSYLHRHDGKIDPEARLLIAYPASALLILSLVLLGFALEHRWHYMVLAVLSALQTVGVMIVTTAISAYLLDAYPEGSGEVGAWVAAGRSWGGFMATFVQIPWIRRDGPAVALGVQAAVTAASVGFLLVLQVWGRRLRGWQGRMVFV